MSCRKLEVVSRPRFYLFGKRQYGLKEKESKDIVLPIRYKQICWLNDKFLCAFAFDGSVDWLIVQEVKGKIYLRHRRSNTLMRGDKLYFPSGRVCDSENK